MNAQEGLRVLIVGAGPTGMTAALSLARRGIPSLLLDQSDKLSDGSRAIAYHHTALAVWEQLGAAKPMLEKGIAWNTRHTFFKRTRLYTQIYDRPDEHRLPGFLNLQQYYVERYLLDQIEASPLIDLRWAHRVTGFSQDRERACLEVETPNGKEELCGDYVLACDGARSTMRKLLGLDFPGSTFQDLFLIADIRADLGYENEPRFFFHHPAHPGPSVLIHPQPDGVWRIDWQIGAEVDIEHERSPAVMDGRIKALIGETPYEIVWLSHYRFHQRLIDEFRHGRVFFAGDAAHLVAPFGARGLNSAVLDVENLTWKMAYVLTGLASDALLDSYQTERWPAQQRNQEVTIRTMQFMAPDTPARKRRQRVALGLSRFFPSMRERVDSGKMARIYPYLDSPLNQPDTSPAETWEGAPLTGMRVDDLSLQTPDGKPFQLRYLLGGGFIALCFPEDAEAAASLISQCAGMGFPAPLHVIPVLPPGVDAPDGSLVDPLGELRRYFNAAPGTCYLLRPDGHIFLRQRQPDLEGWARGIKGVLSRG